ncbi:MAG: diguanylate cyclase [Dehalococcoidia bacterium]
MRILLAEDDRFVAHVLSRALQQMGHEVTGVANGREAWELLQRRHYRVVMSDWVMPELDGIELCKRIRRDLPANPYTYVIMLTARNAREHRIEGLNAGVDEFLTKPVDEEELHARLGTAQRLIAMQDEIHRHALELDRLRREAEYHATHDDLTGVLNRRAWFVRALRERPDAIATIDLDHFKRVNDQYGHPAGDHVLKEVVWRIEHCLGDDGVLGRLGGEEFAIAFHVPLLVATRIAQDVVRAIAAAPIVLPGGGHLTVTISAGIAGIPPGEEWSRAALDLAYERADQALYRAKRSGRNQLASAFEPAAA